MKVLERCEVVAIFAEAEVGTDQHDVFAQAREERVGVTYEGYDSAHRTRVARPVVQNKSMPETPEVPRSGADVSGFALILGIVATICALIPMIGDGLATLPALAALVLGFITVRRHETDHTVRVWPAIIGAVLGAITLFVVVSMFLMSELFG
ncbi:MAG: hypothetical protein ACTH4Y_07420 [Microbacterium gubbeenense]|uniref:hypothetical protein n=1 Tax=Microbacterium gubbeenense TaxID=159896 RepID=UPI003F959950